MPDPTVRVHPAPALVGGRYALRGEVGRGGMAVVHRAYDEVLDRPVAVKLLHAHLASDPAFLDRFRREARAAAALAHPNVVAVHDWGETDDGPYLVLQLVEGPTLRDVLRSRRRLDPAQARWVLEPAAEGLASAHAAGLVHRDVKPENLLLGDDGTVRITDFGLARAAASATTTFGADVLVGSPHYLAPEAVQGMPLDPRADVYALGVVLYECLTGRPPHEASSPFLTAMAHTTTPVPPPSDVVPSVGPALDAVVLRATAMQRDDRYPDAGAFARALAAAVPAVAPLTEVTGKGRPTVPPPDPARTAVVARDATVTTAIRDRRDDTEVVRVRPETAVVAPDEHDTDDVDPPRRRGRGWLVLLLLFALIGGSAGGGYLLWDRVLAPVTPIPGVVGAPVGAAVDRLEAAGFEVDVAAQRPYDLQVPGDHVLAQSLEGDARAGSLVALTVSAGPRPVEVADVAGLPEEEAVATLTDDGLTPTVETRHDEQVPQGRTITSDPPAGTVLDETAPVTVVVSRGPTPIEVPDVRGESEVAAREAVVDGGLRIEVVDRSFDASPEGTVLTQDPAPGATLFRGNVVEVTVSLGPAPIEVPNVRGQRVGEAAAELEALGFEVEVTRRGGFGAFLNPDRVYDQDPAPGATRRAGETVLLYAYE